VSSAVSEEESRLEAIETPEGLDEARARDDATETGPLSDATQLYLHQIGLNRLFSQEESCASRGVRLRGTSTPGRK